MWSLAHHQKLDKHIEHGICWCGGIVRAGPPDSPCTPRVGSEGEKENQKPRMPKDEARPGSDGFFMFFLIDVQLCNLHGIIDPTD